MKYSEITQDLFTVDESYYLAHCISSDCAMGAGIATEFQRRFKLREKLLRYDENTRKHPTALIEGKVFNLITKKRYWNKPTLESLHKSLEVMKRIMEHKGITKVAMPQIGAGLDRLNWSDVKRTIGVVFGDTDIEILVCIWRK